MIREKKRVVTQTLLAFRNITDEEYILTGNPRFATASSYAARVYGRPFEWSISLKYSFFTSSAMILMPSRTTSSFIE